MKWVRCVNNSDYADVTVGKVYEVIDFTEGEFHAASRTRIGIINDFGILDHWLMELDIIWFEDVTAEIRDNKINQIFNI